VKEDKKRFLVQSKENSTLLSFIFIQALFFLKKNTPLVSLNIQ
jgi:hypothetical protein